MLKKPRHKIEVDDKFICPTCLEETNIQEQTCQECGQYMYSTRLDTPVLLERHVTRSGLTNAQFAKKLGVREANLQAVIGKHSPMTRPMAEKLVDMGEGPDVDYWLGKVRYYD